MNIKKLKTSELLDKIEGIEDDAEFGEMLDRIYEKIPFADLWERTEELEKRNEELEKEIVRLRKTLKNHAHLDGNVVVKV